MRVNSLGAAFAAAFAACLLLAGVGPARANGTAAPDVERVVRGVEEHYRGIREMEARFIQVARILSYPEDQRSEGKVYLKRPRRMRWDYTAPKEEHYYLDGDELIHYDPSLKQARRVRLDRAGGLRSPLVFFEGLSAARADYAISLNHDPALARPGRIVLQLTPRDRTAVPMQRILLFVDAADFHVQRVDQYDLYGNVTELHFRDVRANPGLADDLFTFKAPAGVEVIQGP